MLIRDGKEYRNIQEQVLKNAQDIAEYMQGQNVLNEFGIKVVGKVDEESDIPSVDDYKTEHEDWSYGDAYAVGTESPYSLYILTRADDEDNPDDYWFDIGEFPLAGPQGADGEDGNNIFRVTTSCIVPTFTSLSLSGIQVPSGYSVKAGDVLLGRYEGYMPGGGGLYTCFVSSVSGTTVNVDGMTNLMDDPTGGGPTYSAGTGITISSTTIAVDFDVAQPRIGLGTGLQWTTSNPQVMEVNFSEVQSTLSAGDGITISGNEIAVDKDAINYLTVAGNGITVSTTELNQNEISVDYDEVQEKLTFGSGFTVSGTTVEIDPSSISVTLSAGEGITVSGTTISVDTSTIANKTYVDNTASTIANSIGSGTISIYQGNTLVGDFNVNQSTTTSITLAEPSTLSLTASTGILLTTSDNEVEIAVDPTVVALQSDIPTVITVSGTASDGNWTSITIGDQTNSIPAGGGGGSSITIDTTAGSEYISDGTNSINVMTRDTDQNVTGIKTFNTSMNLEAGAWQYFKIKNPDKASGIRFVDRNNTDFFQINSRNNHNVSPCVDNDLNLGGTSMRYKDFWIAGNITDGTTSFTVSTIATGLSEGNPTVPEGTTSTSLTGLRIGENYYSITSGGGGGGTTVSGTNDGTYWTGLTIDTDTYSIPTNSTFVDLTTSQTISGAKTFNNNVVIGATQNTGELTLGGSNAAGAKIILGHSHGAYSVSQPYFIESNIDSNLISIVAQSSTGGANHSVNLWKGSLQADASFYPSATSGYIDLGNSTYKWGDLYLNGNIVGTASTYLSDGSASVALSDIQAKSSLSTETWTFTLSGGTTVSKTIVIPA